MTVAAPLRLSANRRYLVDAGGQPFFYLADTAWASVWKGTPDQWQRYLDRRAAQGFSVIQVNLLPWRWEFTDVAGNRPFSDGDPGRPNAAYFARFDEFIQLAAARGLVTCLMLIWGGPRAQLPAAHFTTDQAMAFARYAVARFTNYPMIWSLSGDGEYALEPAKWAAVGAAVAAADPNDHPTTNHLPPSMNWHFAFHDAAWHDFHMLQTGHRRAALPDIAALPRAYYQLSPTKPCVNGEPWYEAHPARDREEYGPVFTPAEVRYAFWVGLLAGHTMGHTYGSQGIWNWKRPGDSEEPLAGPQIGPLWSAALDHAGADHCALGARLLRGWPWWELQPASEQVEVSPSVTDGAEPAVAGLVPGRRLVVYLPRGDRRVTVKGLQPGPWQARWIDPRRGDEQPLGSVEPDFSRRWPAPPAPDAQDWLLVIERPDD